jgi:hypothetical protein
MQVIFRTNKKKISSGTLIKKNARTVIVKLEDGRTIKRHIEKHQVRVDPRDYQEFIELKSVKMPYNVKDPTDKARSDRHAKEFNDLMLKEPPKRR